MNHQTLLDQIGKMNVMAVSGGRVTKLENGISLPVSNGYSVKVTLDASDTYTVERIFTRSGKATVKGSRSYVYADQVGETVYRGSCFHEDF